MPKVVRCLPIALLAGMVSLLGSLVATDTAAETVRSASITAQALPSASSPMVDFQQGEQGAKAFIDRIGQQVLEIAQDSGKPDSEKMAELESLFVSTVDVPWIARFVIGPYWRQANVQQQQDYLKYYQQFIVKHYVGRFTEYAGQTYRLDLVSSQGEGKYLVRMIIDSPNEPSVVTDYRIRQDESGAYKIYDIVVEGVSMIVTQKQEFSSVVARKGLDFLIQALAKKSRSA